MNNLIRSLILVPATICATGAFAADTSTLHVPFSFIAYGKSYPAGVYTVSVDANHQIATLASKQLVARSITSPLSPSDGNPSAPNIVRLQFSSEAGGHELRKIRFGSLSTSDIANLDRSEKLRSDKSARIAVKLAGASGGK